MSVFVKLRLVTLVYEPGAEEGEFYIGLSHNQTIVYQQKHPDKLR